MPDKETALTPGRAPSGDWLEIEGKAAGPELNDDNDMGGSADPPTDGGGRSPPTPPTFLAPARPGDGRIEDGAAWSLDERAAGFRRLLETFPSSPPARSAEIAPATAASPSLALEELYSTSIMGMTGGAAALDGTESGVLEANVVSTTPGAALEAASVAPPWSACSGGSIAPA